MAARRLAARTYVLDDNGDVAWFGPDDTVPAWAAKQITNPDAWASSPAQDQGSDGGDAGGDGDQGDEGKTPSYSSMKKAALEAEVARRNEGREDDDVIEVEGKGNIPDLIAALEADDAAQADTGNNE